MTNVRHYYDANTTLPLELLYIPIEGRDFFVCFSKSLCQVY
jgi:hypothetical protein